MDSHTQQAEPRILALDPSNHCGWAHSDGSWGVWELAGRGSVPGARLERFWDHLHEIQRTAGPIDVLASEHSGMGAIHSNRTASQWELIGVLKLVSARWGVPLHLFAPMTLKKFLAGHGRAEKSEMVRRARLLYDDSISDDNVADAVAVLLLAKQTLSVAGAQTYDDENKAEQAKFWKRRPRVKKSNRQNTGVLWDNLNRKNDG